MSADLLAEFDSSYETPQHDNGGEENQGQTASSQPVTSAAGAFDLSSFSQPVGTSTQTQGPVDPWPAAFQSGPQSSGLWGDMTAVSAPTGFQPQAQPAQPDAGDEDDTWGDFEVAGPSPAASAAQAPSTPFDFSKANLNVGTPQVPAPAPAQVPAAKPTEVMPVAQNRVVRASTMDIISNTLIDTDGFSQTQAPRGSSTAKSHVSKPRDPNILFDADDIDEEDLEEDDDEFGDFETVKPPSRSAPGQTKPQPQSQPQSQPPSMDLLSLADPEPPSAPAAAPAASVRKAPGMSLENMNLGSSSSSQVVPAKSPPVKDKISKSPPPYMGWPSLDDDQKPGDDEDWAAFDDLPSTDAKKGRPKDAADHWDWDAVDTGRQPVAPNAEDDEPPPTNIPPPSVLMSILPELFNMSDKALLKPLGSQSAAAKKKIMSDPRTISFLRSYLLLATVAGRILAGRKLRWHRDKFLSQRMTISAAGAKGMKLAGVDKAQSVREDREAADVADAWKQHVGKLRSAVAAANSSGSAAATPPMKVPEIGEPSTTLRVTTAKLVPTAPRPCVVCGLKRDERVAKVDFDVEDSFGEWWAEHWGHRACRNFWREHEKKLRQR